ncbi:MAG: hypothetical protein IT382_13860 [Deltaproteobacteria bacterium]|nr:hypothetical protein [Deltaproteobacteria bacterium]
MASSKSPDERASDLAQKSENMARELSQKREARLRQERARQGDEGRPRTPSSRPSPNSRSGAEDRTLHNDDRTPREERRDTRVDPHPAPPPFFPDARRGNMLDDVAVELEELLRDLRAGWRRFSGADRITFLASLLVLVGVMLPWTSDRAHPFSLGITAGGVFHAALAVVAIALSVARGRRLDGSGARISSRERAQRGRRASLWHLLIGATSTALCAYFLVIYGLQRSAETGLEIRYGLYVTLAAGMGLSYGGFSRFWSRHNGDR